MEEASDFSGNALGSPSSRNYRVNFHRSPEPVDEPFVGRGAGRDYADSKNGGIGNALYSLVFHRRGKRYLDGGFIGKLCLSALDTRHR